MDPTEAVQIGRSRIQVSRLGLGMAALGDIGRTSDDDALAVIGRTWGLGLRHVDCAAEYGLGLAERRLGAAITPSRPDGAVISTKVGRLIRPVTRSYRLRHTIVESVSSPAGARVLRQKAERVIRSRLRMARRRSPRSRRTLRSWTSRSRRRCGTSCGTRDSSLPGSRHPPDARARRAAARRPQVGVTAGACSPAIDARPS
jgi:hypothetical protein